MPSFKFDRALAAQAEGKALVAHPAFQGRDPVSVYSPGASRQDAVISQQAAARHADAYGGSQAIDWVYDCINLYSDACSTAPFKLTKDDQTKLVRKKTKGTPPDHEVGPESLYTLLDKPNPYMAYSELITLLVMDLMLVGNGYWMKWQTNSQGQPLALYRLAPSHVKIVPDAFGPKRYEYQPPGARKPLKIDPSDIIHFRRPSPHSAYYGMGVIQGGGRAMDLELAITDTMASYFENKADPSLIVQSDRRVPRDVFNKLRAQLRARTAGSKNAGEMLLLESGLKASSLSANARDALFNELSKMSRDRIFTAFRAAPMLFGLMDESTGANKVSDMRREFDNYALRPFMSRLSEQITFALTEAWGVKFVIDHRSILPADEAIKVGESVAKLPGVKIREVRAQYAQFGIEESTGDPEIDEEILNLPLGDLGPDGQPLDPSVASGADQPLSSEPGRPPKVENTHSIGNAAKASGKAMSMEQIEARLEALTYGQKGIPSTPAPDNRLPNEQRPEDTFLAARTQDINEVSAFIAAGLRDATQDLERALLDHVEGKALKTSDLVSRMKRSPAWTTFRERVEAVLTEGARRAAASGVMQSGLNPDDEIDYDAVVKSVIHRPGGVRGIVSTLKDRVANRMKAARADDAERSDYEAAVRAVIAEWSDSQAVTVAETEAVHAYNEATLVTAEASGVSHVYVTDGDDHDEPCVEANGSTWTIEEARANRLEHPRCRRAFLPLSAVA
jgi:HK97 family phage portal protein